jgi:DNA-binding Lrp family transcriptional regulator
MELDKTDRNILRIFSLHKTLTALCLWYELGEDPAVVRRLSNEELLNRLESLEARGLLDRLTDPVTVRNDPALMIFRIKAGVNVGMQL